MTNPLSSYGWSDNDYDTTIGALMGESGTAARGQNRVNEMAGIVDVGMNRLGAELSGRPNAFNINDRNRTLDGVFRSGQFDAVTRTGNPAHQNYQNGRRAARDDRFAATLDQAQQERLAAAKEAALAVASRDKRGLTHNATHFSSIAAGVAPSQRATHTALGMRNGTHLGGTNFYGLQHDRNRTQERSLAISNALDRQATARSNPRTDSPRERSLAGMEASRQPYSGIGQYDTPREALSQPFASGITAPPEWSLADLAPDVTQPPAPDWSRDFTDRPTPGAVTDPYGYSTIAAGSLPPSGDTSMLLGDVDTTGAAARGYPGVTGLGPNAFGALTQPAPPDWGMDQGAFGDRGPPGPYSFSGLQTSSMEPSMAVYDGGPWGYGQQPDYSGITEGITHGPSTANPFGAEPLGAPQGFANYGDQPIGYSPTGFSQAPAQPGMSLAGLAGPGFHTGTDLVGPASYGPNLAEQTQWSQQPAIDLPDAGLVGAMESQISGRPAPAEGLRPGSPFAGLDLNTSYPAERNPTQAAYAGALRDQVEATRGPITGYTETRTPTTVPNPAYEAWQEAYNNPRATPQAMYADDLADKLGTPKGFIGDVFNQAPQARGPAPSRTIAGPDKVTRSPVYGDPVRQADVPRGQPIGGSLLGGDSWGGFGSNFGGPAHGASLGLGPTYGGSWESALAAGIADMNANPAAYGYGGGIGSLGALGGGPANVGSGWGLGGEAGGLGGTAGAAGFSGGDAGYGSDARSGRNDQGNL
jgi:hypothetical protein